MDRRRYPAPGRIVDGLHLWAKGDGATVVLEAGISATSLSWKPVQDRAAEFCRVCSYDRAGLGWSAARSEPRTLDRLVAELRGLLRAAGVAAPYVLVGHSYGGLIVRHYAALHPREVRGLVLVDPVPVADWAPLRPEQAARLRRGVMLSRRGAWLAHAGVVRLALRLLMSGSQAIPRLMAQATAGQGASVTSRLTGEVRKLPKEVWPMIRSHWSLPKSFRAMADYLESLPGNAATVQLPKGIPAILLAPPDSRCEVPEACTRRVAEKSGHWVQLDQPELVVEAIREMLSA